MWGVEVFDMKRREERRRECVDIFQRVLMSTRRDGYM
jgi:hypothetical protein